MAIAIIRHNHLMPPVFPGFGNARKRKIGPMKNFPMTKNRAIMKLQSIDYKIITTYFPGRAAILKSSIFQPFRGTYAFAHTLYNAPP